ncbi:hypothetical protein AFIC_000824 [[Pseudomonas] carboxydohydrogena]|uniref:Cytochrome C and Quinol oxidase polypeptide I n=1 Tax=Afipia carboxydohydrogena TaxID=290 RepID=A0ABY8BQS2_AFICR|nr:hypothetical protein [[Pseudomonas] carboxydohydrogena]WEF52343.1 hypothetical protein AFIC_000824 [[Pseudomonas] carboxydohydrogena]
MRASSLSFLVAALILALGMIWGLAMAISQNHSTLTAHAHLNLLGWVSLFLFGLFYRLHPVLDVARVARLQVMVWVAGTIVMVIGVAMIHMGRHEGEPLAGAGSIMVLGSVVLFVWQVIRFERARAA